MGGGAGLYFGTRTAGQKGYVEYYNQTDNLRLGTANADALSINSSGVVSIGTTTPNVGAILDINSTGSQSSMIVPRGLSSARPSGVNGMIRYNTTTQKFEVFEGLWQNMLSSGAAGAGDNLGNHTASSSIIGVSGSAGGPGYSFAGDTDSGFFSPSAGVVSISTNSTERLRVDVNGNFGIGTTIPTALLHVVGNNQSNTLFDGYNTSAPSIKLRSALSGVPGAVTAATAASDELGRIQFDGNSSTSGNASFLSGKGPSVRSYADETFSASASGAHLRFYSTPSGTITPLEVMRITGGGSVAMGTTSPTAGALLDLRGTGATYSSLMVPRDTTANRPTGVNGMVRCNTTTQKFEVYEGLWQNVVSAGGGGGSTTFPLLANPIGSSGAPAYSYSGDADTGTYSSGAGTVTTASNGTDIFTVGPIGIGVFTTSPQAPIQVFTTMPEVRLSDSDAATDATVNGEYTFWRGLTNATVGAMVFGNSNISLENYTASGAVLLTTQSTERMRVTASGSVGIGTTTPGARLDVAGNVKLGTAGGVITAMGTCSFTQAVTNGDATATCTGVPASSSVIVSCSPTAALSAPIGIVFRATGTANQIALRGTSSASSATWNCVWAQP